MAGGAPIDTAAPAGPGGPAGPQAADTLPPVWRQRPFLLLWGGMCVSVTGSHAAGIAYPLLVLALTGSPAMAGLVSAMHSVPYVLLCLPVGAMVDRWDRRRVMRRCAIGSGLAVATLPVAMAAGALTMPHILAVVLLEGVFAVFYNLAEVAMLPRVVARAQLPQATGMNQAGFAAAGIVGPSLGALLYQAWRGLPFVADALSFLASAWALSRLPGDFMPPRPAARAGLWAELRVGLAWLWHERLVRTMALLTGGLNMVNAALPLLLIVHAKALGASEAQIGLVIGAAGVGGVLGALVGGRVQRRWRFGQVIGGTVLLQALLLPLVGWAPAWPLLGLLYGALMFFGPVYNVVQFSHRIALIPPGLEGRVNAGFRFLAHALFPVGAAAGGWLIEHRGPGGALAAAAVVLAACAVVALSHPAIRHAARLPGH